MKYAEVAVNVPLQRFRAARSASKTAGIEDVRDQLTQTFHYAIPSEWLNRLQLGHLVLVPFGKQEVQGIVVALADESPVAETRYLAGVMDDTPVVSPGQIELAHWMSRHYLSSLFSTLQVMLPPGLEQRSRTMVTWHWEGALPADLPDDMLEIAEYLRSKMRLRSDQLSRRFPEAQWRRAASHLSARGMASMSVELSPPRVRVKLEQMARTSVEKPRLALLASSLGRSSKEARLLALLVESVDPLPNLSALCQAADCTRSVAKRLESRGLVRIQAARTIARLTPAGASPNPLLPQRPSAGQVRAIEFLADLPEAFAEVSALREATGATLPELRALERRGCLIMIDEPATLLPLLSPEQVEEEMIRLRGLERHLAVLELLTREPDPIWLGAIYAETGANSALLRDLSHAGLITIFEQERLRDPLSDLDFVLDYPPRLTQDQEQAWDILREGLDKVSVEGHVYLLHGVTGSGKTELYLRAIERVLARGQQAIVLVPEISLTPQTIRRFSARYPGRITTIHSGLSPGERYDQWRQMRSGQVDIVIGPRSAVFSPFPRLGLIVIDEEHEDAYKAGQMPTYHARDVALRRAGIEGCPVILGSATPSLESYYLALSGTYRLIELPRRVMGHARQIEAQSRRFHLAAEKQVVHALGAGYEEACFIDLPDVEVIDLRHELRAGNRSMFSRALQAGLERALAQGEQAILFLNRRGTATIVSCRDCGHVFRCPRCAVPMTYHGSGLALICHHCNQRANPPASCPVCDSRRIRYLGTGTERVEMEVSQLFPSARLLRWDRDVTRVKGAHQAILDRFIAREADVLIGTQMIAKGLDLPLVTLVGVMLADTGLYLPDFRAVERTYQLLAQVAGRAGRSILGGRVIIQTYTPDHYSIQAAARHDFAGFYQRELQSRRELGYPPFSRLAALTYAHANDRKAQGEAARVATELNRYLRENGLVEAALSGPAPCFFSRVRDKYRWQLILRARDPSAILARFPLPLGWRVDIDPTSLL